MAAMLNMEGVARTDLDTGAGLEGLFHRRIEFHVERKPFSGFGNNSSNGFQLVTLNPRSEPHKESGLGKPHENSERSDIGLDPELSFKITFRRIGAGLRNLGNTCFLNSVLQCLTYTEPLAAYLQNGKHQYSCRTAGFCALCAIQKHVSRALQSSGRILEPKDLVSNLRCISRNFRNARQEDAHEYMVNLLESMHKCCLPSGVPSESPSAYEKSLVHKIFGGRLRSQVKCMQCSYCSDKFDPFLDLSLEIVKAESLYKALAHFTAKEQLDGGAKQYQCQRCNQKVKALKQLTIHKAPHVLAIHLKRFGSHVSGQKIDKNIDFGPTLDLKQFVTGPYDGDMKYTLYGVLVHAGWSTHSGHYYCFVRTSSGMWYSLDDNQVVQVNERKVLGQKAYMLFYVRDRKDFAAKKQVNVGLNENMVMNAIRNVTYPKFNLEPKEKIQNGSVDKRPDNFFSTALSDRDKTLNIALEETPSKNLVFQKLNDKTDAGCLDLKTASQFKPSVAQHLDSAKYSSTAATKAVCHPADSHSAANVSDDAITAGHAGKIVDCNNGLVSASHMNASSKASSDCNGCLDSVNNRESNVVSMPTSCGNDIANNNKNELASSQPPRMASLPGSSGEMLHINGVSSEMVGPSKCVDLEIVKTHESTLNVADIQSKLLSGGQLSRGIAKRKRPQLKVRRKLFKLQVSNMALSSSIIFGGAFHIQKKKSKRRKLHSLHSKSSKLKHPMSGTDSSSHLQSSECNKSVSVSSDNFTPSKRKKSKDDEGKSPKIISGNEIGSSDFVGDDTRPKVGQNGTRISNERELHTEQSVAGVSVSSGDHRINLSQNGMMGICSGGLEETSVARWDDFDVSVSGKTDSGAVGNSQIGYIGDEWDEEYDRGKRKKIRGSKISFDGPNLFQEFATKIAKTKRPKLNRSKSENHPFRIL